MSDYWFLSPSYLARLMYHRAFGTSFEQVPTRSDRTADGTRFLMLRNEADPNATELAVVINWHQELERLGASAK